MKAESAALAVSDDPVTDLVVLRLRKNMAPDQVTGVVVGTLSNDVIGLVFADAGQCEQIFARSFVDIDRLVVAAHAFFHALDHSFRVAAHALGGLRSTTADFVRIVFGCAGSDSN